MGSLDQIYHLGMVEAEGSGVPSGHRSPLGNKRGK